MPDGHAVIKRALKKASRRFEKLQWRPINAQVAGRNSELVAEIIRFRDVRLPSQSEALQLRYRRLLNKLRQVTPALPDPVTMSANLITTGNLIDLALSAARLCFQQHRDWLGVAILQEAALFHEHELELCFLAWQVAGRKRLAELVDNSIFSPQARAFLLRLESGYYNEVLEDLSSCPMTSNGKPRLAIVVFEDLQGMDLFTHVDDTIYFLGRINNPELVISLAQARKEFLPSMYGLLEHLVKFGKDIRVFYLHGVKVQVRSDHIFGPAIDTFFFIKGLDRFLSHHGLFPSFGRILELGAGSGAILYTLVKRMSDVSEGKRIHAIATDVSRYAIAHSELLFEDLIERGEVSFTAINDPRSLTRVQKQHGSGSVDILLVNPPYIPRLLLDQLRAEGRRFTDAHVDETLDANLVSADADTRPPETAEDVVHRATEDLELYVQALLNEGPELLNETDGIMFLLASSISQPVVELLLRRSPLVATEIDQRADVPLDVPEVTSGALRIELLDLPGVTFDITDRRHPIRHDLTVYALFHPGSIWPDKLFGTRSADVAVCSSVDPSITNSKRMAG